MTSFAAAIPRRSLSKAGPGRLWKGAAAIALLVGAVLLFSTWIHLEIPQLTGRHIVGRRDLVWTDPLRPEPRTGDPGDHRQTGLVVWYPAEAGTGLPASYVPDLEVIRAGLVESGELGSLVVTGLSLVRSHSFEHAAVASSSERYPLLVLSPGNATNVEFYGSLAEDLASHGYVVVGLNHPYQVTAMSLTDGTVAVYDGESMSVTSKIAERVADVGFVLDRLTEEVGNGNFLDGRVDLSRIGVVGHSNGGLTAAEVCRSSVRVTACMNIDGQAASGPFGTDDQPSPVGRPFLYLTKETEIHPVIAATFEESGFGTFRTVVPAATHQEFADGPLFRPGIWPLGRNADRVQIVTRGFARAFFDEFLGDAPPGPLDIVEAPTDVYLYGYPLEVDQPR